MSKVRAHVTISGFVQGVGFRYVLRQVAAGNLVRGWARNLSDGRVEAVLEGEEGPVRQVIDWCRHGPPSAEVDDVVVEWQPYAGEYETFYIRG